MLRLRQLVLDTAAETEGVDALEETLKGGKLSYLAKGGSTIGMDWKRESPSPVPAVLQLQHFIGRHVQSTLRGYFHT